MQAFNFKKQLCATALLLLVSVGASVQAATLSVNCGGNYGLTSINAALKALQSSEESLRPATINVSGACHENVVIQSMDRLTLNAVNGASITDVSGGALDVVLVLDSRDVTITGFSINGGANGIDCLDGTLCRLVNDTVQGAGNGIGVFTFGQARLTGVKLNNNSVGLYVNHGGTVVGDATMQGNGRGIQMLAGAVIVIAATITQSSERGVYAFTNATLDCIPCVITDNAGEGVLLRQGSNALFRNGFKITGNGGPGVALSELSSAVFLGGTATGNAGAFDVLCGPQFTSARGATDIGGGRTNCVEPSP
jgi:hypothetical protein